MEMPLKRAPQSGTAPSVASLTLVLSALLVGYFALALALPIEPPRPVQEALVVIEPMTSHVGEPTSLALSHSATHARCLLSGAVDN